MAVTGGAGAGKSTAARYFERLGAAVIDADEVARDVLEQPAVRDELVAAFGDRIVDEAGGVDRARLAGVAFRGAQSVARLNAATHPAITAAILERLERAAEDGSVDVVIIEVALLEAVPVLADRCDEVIAIEAPMGARVARLVERGIAEPDARRRIALQPADADRRRRATAIVVNDADEITFEERLDRVWRHVAEERGDP